MSSKEEGAMGLMIPCLTCGESFDENEMSSHKFEHILSIVASVRKNKRERNPAGTLILATPEASPNVSSSHKTPNGVGVLFDGKEVPLAYSWSGSDSDSGGSVSSIYSAFDALAVICDGPGNRATGGEVYDGPANPTYQPPVLAMDEAIAEEEWGPFQHAVPVAVGVDVDWDPFQNAA